MLFIRRPLKLHSFNKQKTFLLPLEWAWVRRTANEAKADSQEVHLIQAAALDIFLFFHTPTVCRSYVH